MSKKVSELLELLRESDADPAAAVAGSEQVASPGAEANRAVCDDEAKALLDKEVEDLDAPMGDTLLPEADLMAASGAPIADPAAVPAQPEAGEGKGNLPSNAELSIDDITADLDPEIAEIIRMMGESEEAEEADEADEESEDDGSDTDAAAEEKEDFNAVESVSLSEEDLQDVVAQAQAQADAQVDGAEKSDNEEEKELPGAEELPTDQRAMIKRLFDESVSQAVNAKLAQVAKLTEEKLNAKFKEVSLAREHKLNEQVSHYLEYVVETWRKQNEPKLYTSAQVKVAKKIFESVKTLVETLNIETVDVSAQLIDMYEQKIGKLEIESNKLVSENAALVREVSIRDRALIIEEAAKGLPLTEIDNFKAVVAKIKAEDVETFKENVMAMKASFIPKAKKTESIRATNETLALQGGIRSGTASANTEADFIANLIPSGSESNK
jgi:hypothetical protein